MFRKVVLTALATLVLSAGVVTLNSCNGDGGPVKYPSPAPTAPTTKTVCRWSNGERSECA